MRLRTRRTNENDLMLTFNWTNDPLTRRMSFNQDPIPLEIYKEEFNKRLGRKDHHLLIVEQIDGSGKWVPIGQAQVDTDDFISGKSERVAWLRILDWPRSMYAKFFNKTMSLFAKVSGKSRIA